MKLPLLAAALACVSLVAFADEADVKKSVEAKLGKVEKIVKTPIAGMWEVAVDGQIFYADDKGAYLIYGNLLDIKTGKNITAERQFNSLPLDLAMKQVRGTGKNIMVTFEDPKRKVVRAHDVRLANAVHPPDPLLDLHRVPGHVEVDDDVAELEVEAFATSIRRHHHALFFGEQLLRHAPFGHVHGAIQKDHVDPTLAQKLADDLLARDELREDEHLQLGIAFLTLQLEDDVMERIQLGVWPSQIAASGSAEQRFDFCALRHAPLAARGDNSIQLGLPIELLPLRSIGFVKQWELRLWLVE